jgi:hypothetical protein
MIASLSIHLHLEYSHIVKEDLLDKMNGRFGLFKQIDSLQPIAWHFLEHFCLELSVETGPVLIIICVNDEMIGSVRFNNDTVIN